MENALKMKIPLKVMEKDVLDVMDPLYNREKIYDMSIMNGEIRQEGNDDINH